MIFKKDVSSFLVLELVRVDQVDPIAAISNLD